MVYWGAEPSEALLSDALAACEKALQQDSQNASFYALKARVLLARKNYGKAITENEKAIQLNPTFAAAHCGLGDSLAYEGRYEEAMDCFEKAISLSPNDPQLWAFYSYGALALIFKGDYQQALKWAEYASNIPNCQYWANAHKVVALAYLDNMEACKEEATILLKLHPNFNLSFAKGKLFYLKSAEQKQCYLHGLAKAGFK